MGDTSGGEPGPSGLNDLRNLLKKTKEKYQLLHPKDKRWPCPFCLNKEKTLIKCRIHIMKDHQIFTQNNPNIFSESVSQSQSKTEDENENKSQNSTTKDLRDFLNMINDEANKNPDLNLEDSTNSTIILCSQCGFRAKNNRGLKIHLHSCRKKNLSNNFQKDDSSENKSQQNFVDLIDELIYYRSRKRIIKRIPKGARKIVCEELTKTILECATSKTPEPSWKKLLNGCLRIFD